MWPSKPAGTVRILFVGDVFGKPGVETVKALLPGLLRELSAEFCIVNGENAEQGKGLVPRSAREILDAGANVITGGNHTLYRDKIHDILDSEPRVLRPFNFPEGTGGRGAGVFDVVPGVRIAVVNLQGRAMLPPSDDPFRGGKKLVTGLREDTPLIMVDFHAEATAEKLAFARYVDGEVSAVIGTHTHVQTADAEILPGGTAYITDVGMTGPHDGVIGLHTDSALQRFLYPMGGGQSVPAEGDLRLSGVVLDISRSTGRALFIQAFQKKLT